MTLRLTWDSIKLISNAALLGGYGCVDVENADKDLTSFVTVMTDTRLTPAMRVRVDALSSWETGRRILMVRAAYSR